MLTAAASNSEMVSGFGGQSPGVGTIRPTIAAPLARGIWGPIQLNFNRLFNGIFNRVQDAPLD